MADSVQSNLRLEPWGEQAPLNTISLGTIPVTGALRTVFHFHRKEPFSPLASECIETSAS